MNYRPLLSCFVVLCIVLTTRSQPPALYKDSSLPVPLRVSDLLKRMTTAEKFWQLFMIPGDIDEADSLKYYQGIFGFQVNAAAKGDAGGQLLTYSTRDNATKLAQKINRIQHYFIEKSRLGIPIIAFDEALHGLVRDGATVFPQSIALAATFDTTLMRDVAKAIASETRMRGIRQILSPVVNIASDVRWGRTEETYGEDPFLTSEMGVAFVSEFEKMGIITTPKHFIANVGDGGRDSYPVHMSERVLEEIYLPPFRACIERGGSRSIMTAYNSFDGIACSSNSWLLQKKLKDEYKFNGFIISDANAVGGELVLHKTAADYAQSAQHAINNGLDVIFQTDYKHHQLFIPPFLDGRIDSLRLNDAVSRVLKAKFELGLFERPYVDENNAALTQAGEHKAIARKAALESIVLLKNADHTLPVSNAVKTIAIIGTDAMEARLGGYAGPGHDKISILTAIREQVGRSRQVSYAPGPGRADEEYVTVSAKYLNNHSQPGLEATYFPNVSLAGEPALRRTDHQIDFHWTLFAPDTLLTADFYSVRWTGNLTSPKSGRFRIGLEGNDGYRLYINSKLIIDNWQKSSYQAVLKDYLFEKNKTYAIRVEFFEPRGNATIKLIWNAEGEYTGQQKINEAVASARKAGLAIIVAGIKEGEFQDRAMLSLPGLQEELIQRVTQTGTPVIVVLIGGSAITMKRWLPGVKAVIDAWYPGEEGGHAVADVLLGKYNPAGRLPVTFPMDESQLPLSYLHLPTGRGDDYNNLSGLPLFPFGYGLSYSSFEYSEMKMDRNQIGKSDTTIVRFTVKNTGSLAGDEVAQLYVHDVLASVARPVLELKGFQRFHLEKGESREVTFAITPAMLSMIDNGLKRIVEPGDFRIMIGASSIDLRLKKTLRVGQ